MNSPCRDLDRGLVLLDAEDGNHARSSGYSALAAYLPDAQRISEHRSAPRGILQRATVSVLSRLAVTNWYQLSSAALEWRAWQRGRRFDGIFHMMWADRDWGFLDLVLNRRRHRLCGTFHGCPDSLPDTLHFRSRFSSLDAVILMSEVQRDFFQTNGVPAEKIHVVHHGVDTTFFTPGPARRDRECFKVLSVGSYRRNFQLLRKVCERLANERSVRFKIVTSRQHHKLFAGLDNVEVATGLSDDELLETYRQADCLLLTTEAATANNGLLEALACGLPVVAETIGGIPEYVSPECAKLVPPGSDEALEDAIGLLRRNRDERGRMSAFARRRAEELDWKNVAEKTKEVYRQIT